MTAYFLDTNIVSEMMRDPKGAVRSRLGEVGEDAVLIGIIVLAELRFGVERRRSPQLAARLEAVLGEVRVVGFEPPADLHYAKVRSALERIGQPLGQNDMLIAAHALALDAVLVTDDGAFSRVPGLKVENWLRRGGT